ncbi:hypothetical protein GGG16DRAFT_44483 [Schizophyllum commune]
MSAMLENRLQALSIEDGQSSLAKRRRQSGPSKAQRGARYKFHKRLHPSHADLPYVPPERDHTTRYWHFGWPVSDETVTAILQRYAPAFFNESHAIMNKYVTLTCLLKSLSNCSTLRFVLVEPDASAPWQSPMADEGERAVSFYMVVSDCNKHFFTRRPTKEQVQRLNRLFGYEPRWMMDAREKTQWKDYGHRD